MFLRRSVAGCFVARLFNANSHSFAHHETVVSKLVRRVRQNKRFLILVPVDYNNIPCSRRELSSEILLYALLA